MSSSSSSSSSTTLSSTRLSPRDVVYAPTQTPKYLASLKFENKALRELSIDSETRNFVRRVRGAHFSLVRPTPLLNPRLIAASDSVLVDLLKLPALSSFTKKEEREEYEKELALFFGGNAVLPQSEPAAHVYVGDQFGSFAGQLGDGRAMYLGQVNGQELQLKGAGKTPYSRTADGRAVLRSSIREFLCSEAMFALGIPTTRAATLVVSETRVERDRMYSGDVRMEPCAVVLRVSPSFIRLGSFQTCMESEDREGPSLGLDTEILPPLLQHVISTHFPQLAAAHAHDRAAAYRAYFAELVERVAACTARWQCVGFCHGVLNTDNVSAIGVTIDYGPFGFMERFDRDYICNTSDNSGRYSYASQPTVIEWNLRRLATALGGLAPLLTAVELNAVVDRLYMERFKETYRQLMRSKLGIAASSPAGGGAAFDEADDARDDALVVKLLDLMEHDAVDFTNAFRLLALIAADGSADEVFLDAIAAQAGSREERAAKYRPTVPLQQLRQYVQIANQYPIGLYQMGKSFEWLEKEIKNRARFEEVLAQQPDVAAERTAWRAWLTQYRERLVSARMTDDARRVASMNASNPKYVLRNWVAEEIIRAAEDANNMQPLHAWLDVLLQPFADHGAAFERFCRPAAPEQFEQLAVSCSS